MSTSVDVMSPTSIPSRNQRKRSSVNLKDMIKKDVRVGPCLPLFDVILSFIKVFE